MPFVWRTDVLLIRPDLVSHSLKRTLHVLALTRRTVSADLDDFQLLRLLTSENDAITRVPCVIFVRLMHAYLRRNRPRKASRAWWRQAHGASEHMLGLDWMPGCLLSTRIDDLSASDFSRATAWSARRGRKARRYISSKFHMGTSTLKLLHVARRAAILGTSREISSRSRIGNFCINIWRAGRCLITSRWLD